MYLARPAEDLGIDSILVYKGALFQDKGGPLVLEEPAWHHPHQGRGWLAFM